MERISVSNDFGNYIIHKISPVDPSFEIQTSLNEFFLYPAKNLRPDKFVIDPSFLSGVKEFLKQGASKNVSIYIDNNTLKHKITK